MNDAPDGGELTYSFIYGLRLPGFVTPAVLVSRASAAARNSYPWHHLDRYDCRRVALIVTTAALRRQVARAGAAAVIGSGGSQQRRSGGPIHPNRRRAHTEYGSRRIRLLKVSVLAVIKGALARGDLHGAIGFFAVLWTPDPDKV
jgi:hypothetical protein